ncbi:MAG: gliding motility-associated C-terminal domain-containing protein, partial [Bacteroidetes bacterium]|nr:gliding motility-associated C-terminal domain-containing protein [Bacteroidota bacterium]
IVYNKNHDTLSNGYGLAGSYGATQSAVILPEPGNDSIYYIFTVNSTVAKGHRYSIVNMHKDGGLGEVIIKNVLVYTGTTEKITAVNHANKSDLWILTHKFNSDSFIAYRLGKSGLDITNPVISTCGTVHTEVSGYLKAAPSGKNVALAISGLNIFELLDFDHATGKLSNPITLKDTSFHATYGVEFSPDGTKLYGSAQTSKKIYQFDLGYKDALKMTTNAVVLENSFFNIPGALQIGPNGKIYIALKSESYLDAILFPNKIGTSCNYAKHAVSLAGRTCREGLPTFLQTYFIPYTINFKNACFEDSTLILLSKYNGIDSILWNFGDKSNPINTSRAFKPSHIFSAVGSYKIMCLAYHEGETDTIQKTLIIYSKPSVKLGNDTSICPGTKFTINLTQKLGQTYLWSDGTTKDIISIKDSGIISVAVKDSNGCITVDTIKISLRNLPKVSLGNTTTLCKGAFLHAKATFANSYLWQNGSKDSFININNSGTYWVQALNICGGSADTIKIKLLSKPTVFLGIDTTLCLKQTIMLHATYPNATYVWQDGTKDSVKLINDSGIYKVAVSNNCGSASASININFKDCHCYVYMPNTFTPNGDGLNDILLPSSCETQKYDMKIYSRWGELIFETQDINEGWNGDFFSKRVAEGCYLYIINLKGTDKVSVFKKGIVQLIR